MAQPEECMMSKSPLDLTRRDAIKGSLGAASLAALASGTTVPATLAAASMAASTTQAEAQDTSEPSPQWRVTQPATGISMQPGYARTIAQMAYVWGWPMVNM